MGADLIIQQRAIVPLLFTEVTMGMIGFDIACKTVRSGSRMQTYLVNDVCKI
jgi:hypothetical protein